jgi:hypothetical protein
MVVLLWRIDMPNRDGGVVVVAAQSVNNVRRLSTTKHDAEASNKVARVGLQ